MIISTSKINTILLIVLLIFIISCNLPHFLNKQIPIDVEDKLFKLEIYSQEEADLLDKIMADEVITWKEYLNFIWRR